MSELMQAYQTVMKGTVNMALATSVGDAPNVRVVTYGYDEKTPGKVYFTTFAGNRKIAEFEQNPRVAILPLPEDPDAPAQVRIHGRVQKSGKSLDEVGALILQKAPFFAETLEAGRDGLLAYEVDFAEAMLTIGMTDAQTLRL